MRIDTNHEMIQGFRSSWKLAAHWPDSKRDKYGKALQADLAASIVRAALPYGGQLILTHHEFLMMEPSGVHSFAHGSEMQSKMVYWVTVARLPRQVSLERTKGSSSVRRVGWNGPRIRLSIPERFFFPVRWTRQLWPVYLGFSSRPSFTLERSDKKLDKVVDDKLLDIGALGGYLFRISPPDKLDWATKIHIVIGTRAVKSWLIEHRSTDTYEQIRSRSEFR